MCAKPFTATHSGGYTPLVGEQIGRTLDERRQRLWRLAYQLTGDPAQADDIVQETFVRALERWPPADDEHLTGWLVRVATNLGIDALRRRKRAAYVGPWLPAPVDTAALEEGLTAADTDTQPEVRYALRESVSYAFLRALEVLTPRQRSVLLLRDVLGYSAREAADVLATTEASVRIAHHRARRALGEYDEQRCAIRSDISEATLKALGEFMACVREGDAAGLEKLIAESAVVITDAGGEFNAVRRPLVGREHAIHFHLRVAVRRRNAVPEVCNVNGLPAVFVRFNDERPRSAPAGLLRCELDGDGRIREIQWVLKPAKLTRFRSA